MFSTFINPQKTAASLMALLVCVGTTACFEKKAQPAPSYSSGDVQPAYYPHIVRFSGETLGIISGWYTGTSKNWERIAAANPGLQPERINIGQQINIPSDILMRDQPLSEEYVRRFYSGSVDSQAAGAKVEQAPSKMDAEASPEGMDKQQEDPFASLLGGDNTADEPSAEAPKPPEEAKSADDTDALLEELTSDEPAAKPAPEEPKAEAGPDDEAERERLLDELLGE